MSFVPLLHFLASLSLRSVNRGFFIRFFVFVVLEEKFGLGGVNVIDTASNYRMQRAERSVGRALSSLFEEGVVAREELFVSTKCMASIYMFFLFQPYAPCLGFHTRKKMLDVRVGAEIPNGPVLACSLFYVCL